MPSPPPIRVLLAEDSPTVRFHLMEILHESNVLQVVGVARNGEQALSQVMALSPDVVSMDVQMPIMDGLEATRRIMRTHPTPVVVVSGMVEREIDLSIRALQAGALAVVPKPPARQDAAFAPLARQLTSTLQAMAGVHVVRRWASVYEVQRAASRSTVDQDTRRVRQLPELIAIGASAGGPSALATLIGGLRNNLSVPMLIVQHMPSEFLGGLVRWLSKFTELPVRIAAHNEILMPSVIHLAPGGVHLRVRREGRNFVSLLDADAHGDRYQPSANVLFNSVAQVCGSRGVGIVLTGMGDDGALGLLAMREAGARTFAQDEASCTVFGMPAAAIALNAAERVMSPAQIATLLNQLM